MTEQKYNGKQMHCIDFSMWDDRAVNYYLGQPNKHTLHISSASGLGKVDCGHITLATEQTPLTQASKLFLEITDHQVAETMQGKGFGTKLLTLAQNQALIRSKCLAVRPFGSLDQLGSTKAVHHFYKQHGFREISHDEIEMYAQQLMNRQQQTVLFSYGFDPSIREFNFNLGTDFTEELAMSFAGIPPQELNAIYEDAMRARFGNLEGCVSNLDRFRHRLNPYMIQTIE